MLFRLHNWMHDALSVEFMTDEQNRRFAETIERERERLRNFIRKRVLDDGDALKLTLDSRKIRTAGHRTSDSRASRAIEKVVQG